MLALNRDETYDVQMSEINMGETGMVFDGMPKVGIGRPVEEGWSQSFQETLESVKMKGMLFTPRQIPGVIYVAPDDLMPGDPDRAKYEIAEASTIGIIERLIKNLKASGTLNPESAEETVYFYLKKFWFRSCGGTIPKHHVIAQLEDSATNVYENGFLCQNERAVIRQTLGLDNDAISVDGSKLYVAPNCSLVLGTVEGPFGPIGKDGIASTLSRIVTKRVPLLGVGMTRI